MADIDPPDLHVVPVAQDGPATESDDEPADLLDARKEALATCCAEGSTLREASTATGIPYRTCRRYRRLPEVQARIRELAREAIQAGTLSLGQGAAGAAKSLRAIAEGKEAAEGPRVSACRSILEIGLRVVELDDVQEQLDDIKAQLASLPGNRFKGRM